MPGRAQSPDTDSSLVPEDRSVPRLRNQSAPCRTISAAVQ